MAKTVCIIGGGVVGCMTALALAKRGFKVTMVERGEVAKQSQGASSWAGAGILFPLLPWHYNDALNMQVLAGARQYSALSAELLAETGIDVGYLVSGMTILNHDTAKAIGWCESNYVQFTQKNNQLMLPNVGQIRPPRLMQALRAYLIKLGVNIIENTVLRPMKKDFAQLISNQGDEFTADYYVIASGAWSADLSEEITIKPMRGQMLRYANVAHLAHHIMYKDGVYIVPRKDGELLIGSTVEDVGFNTNVTFSALNTLKLAAQTMIPELKNQQVAQHWTGLRPCLMPIDSLPMVAQHPILEHLFINTGHFRYGLTIAPLSADIISHLIV